MSYILSDQRDVDVDAAFENYGAYLNQNKSRFPSGAYGLATSDWYFNPGDQGCPHDGWLEEFSVIEIGRGDRRQRRSVSAKIKLFGAHDDGFIELFYPEVFRYDINSNALNQGHKDWRYDEFRISESGHLIHEIEWWGQSASGKWLIEASDIRHSWSAIVD